MPIGKEGTNKQKERILQTNQENSDHYRIQLNIIHLITNLYLSTQGLGRNQCVPFEKVS